MDRQSVGHSTRNLKWHGVASPRSRVQKQPQLIEEDCDPPSGDQARFFSSQETSGPSREPSSMPLNDFDSDAGSEYGPSPRVGNGVHAPVSLSHAATFTNGMLSNHALPRPPSQPQLQHSTSAGPYLSQQQLQMSQQPAAGPLVPVRTTRAMTDVMPYTPPLDMGTYGSQFRQELMNSRNGSDPLPRYRCFTKLFHYLERDMKALGLTKTRDVQEWTHPAHLELLRRVVEVGESLAIFGTGDWGERSNSSRAINSKDYAHLLKEYGDRFWPLFTQDFIEGVPPGLQEEMLAVRGLLTTRFEANSIIAEQLLKRVGLEAQGGGQGAVVFNTSVVSANPVNHLYHKAQTKVQTYAAAASKALQKSHNRIGAMALGGLAGLWLLKRTGLVGFIPGLARPRRKHRMEDDSSDGDEDRYSRGRGRGRRSGGGGREERLSADERLLLAFDHVDRSYKELQKAQKDIELLQADWRFGPVRLFNPVGGPDPPGFEPLDLHACDPREFIHAQLDMQQPRRTRSASV